LKNYVRTVDELRSSGFGNSALRKTSSLWGSTRSNIRSMTPESIWAFASDMVSGKTEVILPPFFRQSKDSFFVWRQWRCLKTANKVCRGAGKFSMPRSLRARSPHAFAFAAAVPPLTDEKFSEAELREPPLPRNTASNTFRVAIRSSLCSASRFEQSAPGEKRGDSAFGDQPSRLDRGNTDSIA